MSIYIIIFEIYFVGYISLLFFALQAFINFVRVEFLIKLKYLTAEIVYSFIALINNSRPTPICCDCELTCLPSNTYALYKYLNWWFST